MWSRATQTWTDILFVTHGAEIPDPDDTLSFIQNVELAYMAAAGITASPYVFNIKFNLALPKSSAHLSQTRVVPGVIQNIVNYLESRFYEISKRLFRGFLTN